jgi:3-demethoxyubiquinol 3-hydroxylase
MTVAEHGATTSAVAPVSRRDAQTIARIVKVNHAGEYGAICIYRAQIAISRWFMMDMVAPLEAMLAHEVAHCAVFQAAMPSRGTRPCHVMPLWSIGGSALGFVTALMGRRSIWICTAAVETTVHHHLDDQLHFLAGRDAELHSIIDNIRLEELNHVETAESHLTGASVAHRTFGPRSRLASPPNVRCKSYTRNIDLLVFLLVPTFAQARPAKGSKCRNRNSLYGTAIRQSVSIATHIVIWLSTWGDSSRMARDLA